MKRYYEDQKYNVAFERCIDVMAKLMVKYGPTVLKQLEAERKQISFDADSILVPVRHNVLDRMKAYQQRLESLKSGMAA